MISSNVHKYQWVTVKMTSHSWIIGYQFSFYQCFCFLIFYTFDYIISEMMSSQNDIQPYQFEPEGTLEDEDDPDCFEESGTWAVQELYLNLIMGLLYRD